MNFFMKTQAGTRAQVVSEYAIFIGIVVAALIAMNTYMKRGMQARFKDAVDIQMSKQLGETNFRTNQYEPFFYERNTSTTSEGSLTETMRAGGIISNAQNSQYAVNSSEIFYDTD